MSRTAIVSSEVAIGEVAATRPRKLSTYRRIEALWAYLFISPTMISFFVFVLGALIYGLGLSLYRYAFFAPPQFVGLDNFRTLLQDQRVVNIFGNTVYYSIAMVAFDLVWATAVALALNSYMPNFLKILYRMIFFFPVLTSGAVIAIVWRYLFNADLGIINWFLGRFGVAKIPWLMSSKWVRPAVVLFTVWNGVGFNMVLILAGLRSIPKTLYEAADIDGAGRVATFRHITIPLLTPTLFFIIVKGFIGVFQLFDQPFMIARGGPGDASRSIVMYIYELGFQAMRLGSASSVALVLFLIILLITLLQFWGGKHWVFYR